MHTGNTTTDSILTLVSDGVIMMDEKGIVLSVNPAAVSMFGFSSTELIGHSIKFLIPDLFPSHQDGGSKVIGLGRKVTGRRKDGFELSLMITITESHPLNENEKCFIGIIRDVTERKKRQMTWPEKLLELQAILDSFPDLVWVKDLQLRYTYANIQYAAAMNRNIEDILGATDFDLFPEEMAMAIRKHDAKVMKTIDMQYFEEKTIDSNGETSYRKVSKYPIRNEYGNIIGILGVCSDVTEIKRTEDLCIRLGRILDDTLNEIYIFEAAAMRFSHANQSACRNIGYTLEELSQLTLLDLMPGMTVEAIEQLMTPLLEGEEQMIFFESSILRKDGSVYPADVRVQISDSEVPPLFMVIVQDSTARKEAEDALRKAERYLLYSHTAE
ncbi:PAS domain S-box protein [Ammoniphilus resinae]|uniref:PAS domain S-box-containing protein n=1 Tax=Ammoniphilus resinae TaxID=861532 RepID=A0ABS4GJ24_9BACL|nr:PAS domain S-box protein [Ammoniphilus resinae]MBP1930246.1 PAS domain S-box-containing protein [Ammoniphilus resinae]